MPSLLIAVDRIVGGIEVEHDAQRRLAVGFEEEFDEQPLDGLRIMVELVMAIPDRDRPLAPILLGAIERTRSRGRVLRGLAVPDRRAAAG